MSKTDLKVIEGREQETVPVQEMPEPTDGFTEELPPLQVDPTSFDARIAGIEPCSVARELAKHWASVTAFEIEQEAAHREAKGEPPISEADEDKRFRERWLEHCTSRHQNPDELVEFIKRKASRFISWARSRPAAASATGRPTPWRARAVGTASPRSSRERRGWCSSASSRTARPSL